MKKIALIFSLFVCLLFKSESYAQGTTCSGAIAITIDGTCASGTLTSTTSTAATPSCIGSNAFNREGWYYFTVSSGPTNLTITGIGNNRNILLQVFSGTCGGTMTEIGCQNSTTTNGTQTETLNLTSLANGTYYIRVLNVGSNGNLTLTSLCVATTPAATGCTSNTSLYPSTTYTPTCSGFTETITTAGYATEYSMISVVTGTTYTFATSISTDYITIANGAGGTPVYAAGTTPVVWTSTITGNVRFYNNTNSSCGTNTTTRNRYVTCGTPPPAPANDNCTGATALTVNTNTTCVTSTAGTVYGATASSQTNDCSGTADDDVWYSFVATNTTHYVTLSNVTGSVTDMYHSVYAGSCGTPGTALVCSDPNSSTVSGLTVGNTYFIRVFTYTSTSGQNTTFNICVTSPPPPPSNDNCTGATALTVNTSTTCVTSTSGTVWGATASSQTNGCSGTADDDVWYSFVATNTTHYVTISNVSGSVTDMYHSVYAGSCGTPGTALVCSDPNSSTLTGLTIGNTYFVRVFTYTSTGGQTSTFDVCITTPPPPPANDNCSGAVALTSSTSGCITTSGNLTDATASGTPSGSCSGTPDHDVWYSFVAAATTHTITVNPNFDSYMQLFSGSCASLTSIQCSDPNTMVASGLTIGNTYYIRVYYYYSGGPSDGTFTICVTHCASVPSNNLPCNAVNIPIGTVASGNNSCSDASGEPSTTPSCWTSGTKNTVWYSFVAPAGGSVKIKTAPGSLTRTQIAVYQGTCGASMTMVTSGCNDNAASCGSTTQYISELSLTGLTAGTTYYIAVDGETDYIGTFAITVVNGSAAYPTSSGQECAAQIPVCSSTMSVGNPGYQGIGFTCDDNGSATDNCTSGERGSVWYTITIQNNGTLYFDIIPNDYDGTYGSETDYDFIMWKITGTGATNCATIASSNGAASVKCNFSGDGVTGLSSTGNAPSPYSSSYDGAYETGLAVTAGEVYVLVVENYSNSTSGFTLDFNTTSSGVINYAPPTTVTWSGGNNTTTWTTSANWGGCTTPTCNINGIVSPSSTFQPTITSAMGTVVVKNLTVDPGATLTLGANAVLQICESLTNNGTIVADPTSTIIFTDNNTAHSLNGTLSGSSSLGNLVITDLAGGTNCTVIANTNIDLLGSFTTTNSTSIFDLNSKTMTLAGNFNNSSAGTTFLGTTASTLIFNGSGAQTYSPGGALTLNNVTMNHTGSGVSITTTGTPNMILGTAGVLTLTSGKIITPGSQQVEVMNTANTAVTTGNTSSYVQGNLKRYLAAGATGSFDFPVGHSTKGYQRANLNFTTAASGSASQLLARFDTWGGTFPQPGAPGWGPECAATYNQPFLDNGYWSIDVASGTSTGTYNITLYNTNYTNAAAGFSVGKSPSASPSWALQGTCVAMCPVTAVQRTGLSGFSKFATIQSSSVLPVQLLGFKGQSKGSYNELKWETSAEENLSHFELESSETGFNFKTINEQTGTGSVNSYASYKYYDYGYFSPVTYYRLKSVDNNGFYRYSSIVTVENRQKSLEISSIFPNPANNEVKINLYVPYETNLIVEITDLLGRNIMLESYPVVSGNNTLSINSSGISEGTYLIICKMDKHPLITNKLIIKH